MAATLSGWFEPMSGIYMWHSLTVLERHLCMYDGVGCVIIILFTKLVKILFSSFCPAVHTQYMVSLK